MPADLPNYRNGMTTMVFLKQLKMPTTTVLGHLSLVSF